MHATASMVSNRGDIRWGSQFRKLGGSNMLYYCPVVLVEDGNVDPKWPPFESCVEA